MKGNCVIILHEHTTLNTEQHQINLVYQASVNINVTKNKMFFY